MLLLFNSSFRMFSKKKPCLYYARGHCSRGNDCSFVHEGVDRNGNRSSIAPRGSCHKYWETGSCSRGFECKFNHIENRSLSANIEDYQTQPISDRHPNVQKSAFPDFNAVAGRPTDRLIYPKRMLPPSAVQKIIANTARSAAKFIDPGKVEEFIHALGSANIMNVLWVSNQSCRMLLIVRRTPIRNLC